MDYASGVISRTTGVIQQFADWLSQTSLSILIQTHNAWVIPTIQSIHIVAIGVVLSSVLMIDLRILGWAGHDQTLRETTNRFGPWLSWALLVLLFTGGLMVIGEPVRELLSFSFWLKMSLVAVSTLIVTILRIALKSNERHWEQTLVSRRTVKSFAILTLLIWVSIVILGRLIAYDYVWGSWSLKPKA
jgi:putative copper export protein